MKQMLTMTRGALALILVATLLADISDVQAQDSALDTGIDAYFQADFDAAIEVFSGLAEDESVDKGVRKEALQYLGRSYIAKKSNAKAKECMSDLLALEPPLIELDPDEEPYPLMKLYYEARKELTGGTEIELPDPGLQTIAIVDFNNNSVDDKEKFDPMQWGFATLMINQLNGATGLKVVERERIQWLADEQDLQLRSGRVDQSTAIRAGKMLGATTVLFGSFIKFRSDLHMTARLVKVETGEILLTESIKGRDRDFFELAENLSLQVAKAINVALDQTEIGARTETRSLDAMISYSEGLAHLDKEEYSAAWEKFQEAINYDPNYSRAKLKADSIYPLIATGTSP